MRCEKAAGLIDATLGSSVHLGEGVWMGCVLRWGTALGRAVCCGGALLYTSVLCVVCCVLCVVLCE